jgi:nucleoid-associated protein YgaU
MSKGTKIVMALGAVLALALVFYYGAGRPDAALALNIDEPPPPPRVVKSAPPTELFSGIRSAEHQSETARRLLRESVEQAVGGTDQLPPFPPPMEHDALLGLSVPDDPMPDPADVAAPSEPAKGDAGMAGPAIDLPASPARPAPAVAPRPVDRPAPAAPAPPPTIEYTVKVNDTMVSIAEQWFGDASKWDLIAKANPLVDPNRLRVGQTLRLPPKDASREQGAERAAAVPIPYVVKSGDTLTRIAGQYYGNSGMWRIIYDANRSAIGDDPNALRVGVRLTIPPAPTPAKRHE